MTELVSSIFVGFLGVITTAAGSAITWRIAKRKNNAEAKISEINADSLSASLYQNLLDDAIKRLDAATSAIKERDLTIESLVKANKERDATIESLIRAAQERDATIEKLMKKIEVLTRELQKHEPTKNN